VHIINIITKGCASSQTTVFHHKIVAVQAPGHQKQDTVAYKVRVFAVWLQGLCCCENYGSNAGYISSLIGLSHEEDRHHHANLKTLDHEGKQAPPCESLTLATISAHAHYFKSCFCGCAFFRGVLFTILITFTVFFLCLISSFNAAL